MKNSLTTGQIASHCGVNFRTVIRWIERGLLKAYKLPGRGDNRVLIEDFVAFLDANNLPIPTEFQRQQQVLVVDDDIKMAKAIRRVLTNAGYTVELAANGFEAGVKLSADLPLLMTLDLNMPGMGGIAVLDTLRQRHGNRVKVLIISGASPRELQQALDAGANDTLEKPFANADLLAKVAELLPVN